MARGRWLYCVEVRRRFRPRGVDLEFLDLDHLELGGQPALRLQAERAREKPRAQSHCRASPFPTGGTSVGDTGSIRLVGSCVATAFRAGMSVMCSRPSNLLRSALIALENVMLRDDVCRRRSTRLQASARRPTSSLAGPCRRSGSQPPRSSLVASISASPLPAPWPTGPIVLAAEPFAILDARGRHARSGNVSDCLRRTRQPFCSCHTTRRRARRSGPCHRQWLAQ